MAHVPGSDHLRDARSKLTIAEDWLMDDPPAYAKARKAIDDAEAALALFKKATIEDQDNAEN
jgi:hypothetical protein